MKSVLRFVLIVLLFMSVLANLVATFQERHRIVLSGSSIFGVVIAVVVFYFVSKHRDKILMKIGCTLMFINILTNLYNLSVESDTFVITVLFLSLIGNGATTFTILLDDVIKIRKRL